MEKKINDLSHSSTVTPVDIPLKVGETMEGEEKWVDLREAHHLLVLGISKQGTARYLDAVVAQLENIPALDVRVLHSSDSPEDLPLIQAELERVCREMDERKGKRPFEREIVLVLDEFSAYANSESLFRLLWDGTGSGIHLILASGSDRMTVMNSAVKCNILMRILFKESFLLHSYLDDADAKMLLAGEGRLAIFQYGAETKIIQAGTNA